MAVERVYDVLRKDYNDAIDAGMKAVDIIPLYNQQMVEMVSETVEGIVDIANSSVTDKEQLAYAIALGLIRSHRTLQAEFFPVLLKAIRIYSKADTDPRNMYVVEQARILVEEMDKLGL